MFQKIVKKSNEYFVFAQALQNFDKVTKGSNNERRFPSDDIAFEMAWNGQSTSYFKSRKG